MKYISFCLYGDHPRYCQGMIRNAELAPVWYPGWQVLVYHDKTVPAATLQVISILGCRLVDYSIVKDIPNKMQWRFMVNDLKDADRYIVRDADSRLNERERDMVAEWEASKLPFHVIRDHPMHGKLTPVGGGMWGAVKGLIPSMRNLIIMYKNPDTGYGYDQEFLKNSLWPSVRRFALQHDCETPKIHPPAKIMPRKDWRFVGERFDENHNPFPDEWKAITGVPPPVIK